MKKAIEIAIKKCIEMGWITKNPHLTDEALYRLFVETMKEVTVRDFLEDEFSR